MYITLTRMTVLLSTMMAQPSQGGALCVQSYEASHFTHQKHRNTLLDAPNPFMYQSYFAENLISRMMSGL